MRRLPVLLVLLLSTQTLFAADRDPALRDREPGIRRGAQMILHSAHVLSDEDQAELASKGVRVVQPLTGGRYLARVAKDVAETADARIVRLQPLTADEKIHASLYRELSKGNVSSDINVFFSRDVPFEEARAAVLAAGGSLANPLVTRFAPTRSLRALVPAAGIEALTADERVMTLAGPHRFRVTSHNADSAFISKVTELYAAPYNLSGDGVTVSLFELGQAQADHVEFGGRLTALATGGSTGDQQHATHVAGTIGAAGVRPDAKGMAPAVRMIEYEVGDQDTLFEDKGGLAEKGVVVDNNSWGYVLGWSSEDGEYVWNGYDAYYGAYDLISTAPLDEISNETGVLFVHSAGNDGDAPVFTTEFSEHRHLDETGDTDLTKMFCYSVNNSGTDCPAATCGGGCETAKHHTITPYDTIGVTAAAKNVISVGALSGSTNIVGFSSRGPAKDGRVKPDVVALGFRVLSTIPTGSYGTLSGTSMAAPAVTGIAALLTEQWRKTFGGANPTPSQLKSVIIAGADDRGNPGPDYTYGFGLVNAKNSADTIIADGGTGKRIRTVTATLGSQSEIPVIVGTTGTLRVVLGWADPSIAYLGGDDIAAKALVNDLDLRVVGPTGTTFLPYVLDKNNPTAAATTGVNTIDNTELVEIPNAVPGTYRIIVAGTAVTEGPQNAVVVASSTLASPCRDLTEPNDSIANAYGNLVPGQVVRAAVCSQADADFYKFAVTKSGPITVEVTSGDTPLRLTASGGFSGQLDIPANSTRTLSFNNTSSAAASVTLKFEATAAVGADPAYSFVPRFGETNQPRRRAVR